MTERLKEIASFLPADIWYGDIGADRGELAYALLAARQVRGAILGDISPRCLKRAEELFDEAPFRDQVCFRCGDGLTILAPGEVDYVVIAGMGGRTVCDILEKGNTVCKQLSGIIIQAMTDVPTVRQYLADHSFHLADEALLEEEGHFYTVLHAVPGLMPIDDFEVAAGPCLLAERHPLLPKLIEKELVERRDILKSLAHTGRGRERRQQLEREIEFWEELSHAYFGGNMPAHR